MDWQRFKEFNMRLVRVDWRGVIRLYLTWAVLAGFYYGIVRGLPALLDWWGDFALGG